MSCLKSLLAGLHLMLILSSKGSSGQFCNPTDSCGGHYSCEGSEKLCLDGWSGPHCQTSNDEIQPLLCLEVSTKLGQSCANGATCWNGGCCCAPGFGGETCEIESDSPKTCSIIATPMVHNNCLRNAGISFITEDDDLLTTLNNIRSILYFDLTRPSDYGDCGYFFYIDANGARQCIMNLAKACESLLGILDYTVSFVNDTKSKLRKTMVEQLSSPQLVNDLLDKYITYVCEPGCVNNEDKFDVIDGCSPEGLASLTSCNAEWECARTAITTCPLLYDMVILGTPALATCPTTTSTTTSTTTTPIQTTTVTQSTTTIATTTTTTPSQTITVAESTTTTGTAQIATTTATSSIKTDSVSESTTITDSTSTTVTAPVVPDATISSTDSTPVAETTSVATQDSLTTTSLPETTTSPPIQGPRVTQVTQTIGPRSGGTLVTITGFELKPNTSISIGPLACPVTSSTEDRIICETLGLDESNSDLRDQALPVRLSHENYTINTTHTFTYVSDPTISEVKPLASILEGGVIVTVSGSNLDAVSQRIMEVTLFCKLTNTVLDQYETLCEVQSSTEMHCPTPAINETMLASCSPASGRRRRRHVEDLLPGESVSRQKRQTNPEGLLLNDQYYIVVYIGFKLDAVPTYRNLSAVLPNYCCIQLFRSPEISQGNDIKYRPFWPYHDDHIRILGSGLNLGPDSNLIYLVHIGSGLCTDIKVFAESISCAPPQVAPAVANGKQNLEVIVGVGDRQYFVANMDYLNLAQTPTGQGIIAGVLIFALLVVVIGLCVWKAKKRRASRQKPRKYQNLQSQPKHLQGVNPYMIASNKPRTVENRYSNQDGYLQFRPLEGDRTTASAGSREGYLNIIGNGAVTTQPDPSPPSMTPAHLAGLQHNSDPGLVSGEPGSLPTSGTHADHAPAPDHQQPPESNFEPEPGAGIEVMDVPLATVDDEPRRKRPRRSEIDLMRMSFQPPLTSNDKASMRGVQPAPFYVTHALFHARAVLNLNSKRNLMGE